jgi:4-amino-4-deoxy-L-arabinose transferase-like glycosyltransferase
MAKTSKHRISPERPDHQPQERIFPADVRRQETLVVALVLLVAALLRVVYLMQYKAHVPYYSAIILDSIYYDSWAWKVAQGKGYGPMPFYMAPLYPYVLAVIYKLFGHSLGLVYALQSALGVVNTYLVYILTRRMFGHKSGIAAMVIILAYAPLMYLEPKILTETLSIFLNLASLLLVMKAVDQPGPSRFTVAGLVLGLSALCRPNALLTIALVLVWLPSVLT